jgi:TolB-like protein/Tfp pilus assembly protein PilF
MTRQLTAIMFADMVGYTALMQDDEEGARRNRDRNRAALVKRVDQHAGKILQFYGDGALSVFQSAIGAVEAAIAIQTDLRSPPPVPVRIGIHTGDIIHDQEGVFGDGVNLAARVQGLAAPGGILISERVFDDVKNQRTIETRSLGPFALKNVKKPMQLWAITNEGLAVPDPEEMGSRPSESRNSVAVLPFLNMSSDPENEFFSDGITEELINALTRVNGLMVTARTSSFAFKGESRDVREIAEELGVVTVLEGSVRRAGERVRITAQLINAADGYHLFSKSYDRELVDIFETQDEIAHTIVEELQDRFRHSKAEPDSTRESKTREQRLAPKHLHDTEAYTELLKGMHSFRRWTPEGARTAIQHFERSVELDPDCGLPFAGLATAHTFLAAIGHSPGEVAYPKAREAASKAIKLEEGAGESHAAMAAVLLFHDWDTKGAYRHFQKALTLSPGSAGVRHLYSRYLLAIGEMEAAEEELHSAIEMDPLSSALRTALAETVLHNRGLEEAEAHLRRVLDLDPEFRSAREGLGWTLVSQGRLEEALEAFEEINKRTGDPFKVIPHRIFVLARMGREDEAHQLFRLLEERREREPEVSLQIDFAVSHLGLGDPEGALDYLEEAVDERLGFVIFMAHHLLWDEIRSHPRFQQLVERVGVAAPRESP